MKKQIIALLLVLTLIISSVPSYQANAAEKERNYEVCETVVNAVVRKEANKKSEVLSEVPAGTILFCEGFVKNRFGNIWMRIIDAKSGNYGYIYSERVRGHCCEFHNVDGTDVQFCKCGNLKTDMKGKIGVADAMAIPNPVINPDVLISLGAAATAVQTGLAATMPYIAVAVVGGTLIYFAISVTQNSAIVNSASTTWEKVDENFKPEEKVYFVGQVKTDYFYIDVSKKMNEYEAMKVIDKSIWANALVQQNSLWFVYTVRDTDALKLVDGYLATRSGFESELIEDAHDKGSLMRQFKHYHITRLLDPYDHLGGHIAFGTPELDTLWGQGAWVY